MGDTTGIAWTDATFNCWIGCSKVNAGCKNCYAETLMDARYGRVAWGPKGTRMLTSPANWAKPLKWNRDAEKSGVRSRVFCASLADVFEEWGDKPILDHRGITVVGPDGLQRSTMNDIRERLFKLIDATRWLDWQLLTKRPENILKMWPDCQRCNGNGRIEMLEHCPQCKGIPAKPRRENVWLGTSVSDQETANQMIPELLKCRDLVPVLFVSAEPLLGPIEFTKVFGCQSEDCECHEVPPQRRVEYGSACGRPITNLIDWIIVGGESGPKSRPCDLEWSRAIIHQCACADVPCFHKQIGSVTVDSSMREPDGTPSILLGIKDKKGGDPAEWPIDLRVRQFPKVERTAGKR